MVVVLLMYAWGFEWLGFPIATAILTMVIGMQAERWGMCSAASA